MSPLNITQPLGIWSIMATISGDVQYTQNGTVTNPCILYDETWGCIGLNKAQLAAPQLLALRRYTKLRVCSEISPKVPGQFRDASKVHQMSYLLFAKMVPKMVHLSCSWHRATIFSFAYSSHRGHLLSFCISLAPPPWLNGSLVEFSEPGRPYGHSMT